MQTDTRGELGGLGIEIGMEAERSKSYENRRYSGLALAGIKAGDYIVKIGELTSSR